MSFSLCHSIKQEYERLQTLTQEFVSACAKGKQEGNFQHLTPQELTTLQLLKQRVETARDALKEKLNIVIHVKDAKNPYREALLASGIPNIETNPLSAEKKDVTVNLRETIKKQQEIYRSMGLHPWAENIATLTLSHLTPEKQRTIEQEVKDGAIPIIMPNRETQLNTTVEQFKTAFKPTWIKDGEEQQANDAYFGWDHFIKLITTKAKELVDGIPDHPYFSMMHPTQNPDEFTTNQTVVAQLRGVDAINKSRATGHRPLVDVINPHEYGALQTVHSRLLKGILPPMITALNPIDINTWTRFINLPLFGGSVSVASWSSGNRRLEFSGSAADAQHANWGFRLAVRVEL